MDFLFFEDFGAMFAATLVWPEWFACHFKSVQGIGIHSFSLDHETYYDASSGYLVKLPNFLS